jgi:hypothetical protein
MWVTFQSARYGDTAVNTATKEINSLPIVHFGFVVEVIFIAGYLG